MAGTLLRREGQRYTGLHGRRQMKREAETGVMCLQAMLLLFSCHVMSDSLQHHGLQHVRLPCPSPSPGVYPSSCPLSRWCHPTNSSSVTLFSSCLQSFPASGSFPMIWPFASGGQSIDASASASHGKPNSASNHQKLKETKTDSLLETLGEAWTCWQLISDFWSPNLWE